MNCTLSAVATTHGNPQLGIQDPSLLPVALPISNAASLLSCPPPSSNDSLLHLASLSDQSTCDHPLPPLSTISDFCPKPRLRLPLSDEDWEKANNFFQHNLVPRVISKLSADSKYAVLAEGVYQYFDGVFGSVKENQRRRERQNEQQSRLARQVREAKALKSEARHELLQAKKSTSLSQEQVRSIAKKFFQSVRAHNKFKRAHQRSLHGAERRTAHHQCHTNLWRFTKDLLENDTVPDIQPTFSESAATSFFSSTYSSEPRSFTQPPWLPSTQLQWLSSMRRTSLWMR